MNAVLVRAVRDSDAADVAAIFAFEDVVAWTAQVPHRSETFWRDFYKTRDPDALELVGVIGDRAVGHLGLLTTRLPRRKHVANFGIGVHPDFQGQGVGNALMTEMLHQADNWLNLLRVELTVASDNARAIALYQKHGFAIEGETRFDIFSHGRFSNSTHMARFHPGVPGSVLRGGVK